jgi:hypothetical protein
MNEKSTVRYIAVIRPGDIGHVLAVGDEHIRRTVEHETRLGSVIIGEYSSINVAERAVKQALHGWVRPDERSA